MKNKTQNQMTNETPKDTDALTYALHLRMSLHSFLYVLWAFLLTASAFPSVTSAQSSYNFPGAVERLESGNSDNFPDPRESRLWLSSFMTSFDDICNVPGLPLPSGVSIIEFGLAAPIYMAGVSASGMRNNDFTEFLNSFTWANFKSLQTSGRLDQIVEWGILDAVKAAEADNCDNATRILRTATTIMYNYAGRPVNPHRKLNFLSLASPEALKALDVDESEVARFKPGNPSPDKVVEDQLIERVESDLSASYSGISLWDVNGTWTTQVVENGEAEPLQVRIAFFRFEDEDHANIRFRRDEGESWHSRQREVLQTLVYRGRERIDTRTNHTIRGKAPPILVGVLSEDRNTIEGWLYHQDKFGDNPVRMKFTKE